MIYLTSMLRLVCMSVLLALAACPGAARHQPVSAGDDAGPRVVVQAGGRTLTFRVELARTGAEHQRGLMFRNHMDADAGMLFLFDEPAPQTFWMKNTFIPLDMIFIGADHRIVGIVASAEPRTLEGRRVEGDSQFVLELNGGTCARLGIVAGAPVEFLGF